MAAAVRTPLSGRPDRIAVDAPWSSHQAIAKGVPAAREWSRKAVISKKNDDMPNEYVHNVLFKT
jgi:hypothetical protein